ncbi:unnamed protein product [Adineta steineri]|uniref:PPM-type phosphatase domain-containing protein n=1 Tax=Adineta steineri TaxID=433720 RepID=A0A818RW40_9BILA|nr:unnamed protein product [Adineta steineri]CAF3663200.1 unnamed protein product [Adineta steineri]
MAKEYDEPIRLSQLDLDRLYKIIKTAFIAGCHIIKQANHVPRVENNFAMTRVFGNYSLDKNIVLALADIIQHRIDISTAHIVITCHGIWTVTSNEQVAQHA